MTFSKILTPLLTLHKRIIFFFLLLFLLCSFITDENKIRIKTLNFLMPTSFNYLTLIENDITPADSKELWSYVRYFTRLTKYMPSYPEGHSMLGFCYYHSGDHDRAITAYQEAVKGASSLFHSPYNLGIIYYKKGEFHKALSTLENYSFLTASSYLHFVTSSRILHPLINWSPAAPEELTARYKKHYKSYFLLLAMSYYRLKSYPPMFDCARKALSLRIDDNSFYFLAGVAAYHLNNHAASLNLFLETVKRGLKHPDVSQYIGLNLKALGKDAQAVEFLGSNPVSSEPKDLLKEIENNFSILLY